MSKSAKNPTRVLFVCNSFTARNDLPDLIAQLVGARGVKIEHALLSIGGASLRTHWNKGQARTTIERGKFDYVVLQEQSTLPIKNASRTRENVLLFDEAIRAAGAKTVLYMTWARKHMPDKQKLITEAYESIGREIGALVVPVGRVWWRFIADHDSPALHDKDQSYPTLAGSYLVACVFLVTVFGESPSIEFRSPAGLAVKEAQLLQRALSHSIIRECSESCVIPNFAVRRPICPRLCDFDSELCWVKDLRRLEREKPLAEAIAITSELEPRTVSRA